jgi:transposase
VDAARFVVDAVVREGRSYRDVAAAHGVSKSWVAQLVARFREGWLRRGRAPLQGRQEGRVPGHRAPARQ